MEDWGMAELLEAEWEVVEIGKDEEEKEEEEDEGHADREVVDAVVVVRQSHGTSSMMMERTSARGR